MILIISAKNDSSTHDVIDYLIRDQKEYFVVYKEDQIEHLQLKIATDCVHLQFYIQQQLISLSNITSFWFRRGKLNATVPQKIFDNRFGHAFAEHMHSEWEILADTLYSIFENKPSIGAFSKENHNNKVKNLLTAISCGLKVPHTLVFTQKKDITSFANNTVCITKSLNSDIYYNENSRIEFANFGPMLVTPESIEKMGPTYWPSLFQAYVDKKYELRIFILHNIFYASAIFSQSNTATQLDSRVPDYDNPVRMVPYQLPDHIRLKLIDYMQKTDQSSASVDMIVTKNNDYIFLEANPVGQFGYLSFNCNYYLEDVIAQFLN